MDRLSNKICHLAENLLIKGELIIWRQFSLTSSFTSDIEIDPVCSQQGERIIVEKVIASSIVDSCSKKDGSIIYSVEVLAAIYKISSGMKNNQMASERNINYSEEHTVTFTIVRQPDGRFVLLNVMCS